ncbi:MAG: hypothetical protein K9W44_10735 [Candidatus Lokiarchaeota archaeon]|nr:hypothetical protein [Candidatus Harpocratesius repetitus]
MSGISHSLLSSNLTNAGDFVSYRIQYWGKYYANNRTNHFVLAEEQFFQNYTIVTTQWYQMGFWIENSSISLDQSTFLPYYMNLTSLEGQLYEIRDPS